MSLFNTLFPWAKKSDAPIDVENTDETSNNAALRNMALNKCSAYIARTIAKARFVIKSDNEDDKHAKKCAKWWYWLNVRPNPNQSSASFWSDALSKLIKNGEVLLFVDTDIGLLVADSFSRKQELKGDIFTISTVQGQSYERVLESHEAIYLVNENENLVNFTNQLWEDYGKLLGNAISNQLRLNQLRFTLTLPRDKMKERSRERSDGSEGDETKKKNPQKDYINRLSGRMRRDPIVPIPVDKQDSYQEYAGKSTSRTSYVDDIKKLKEQYTDEVAEILGVPIGLIHGEVADNQKNYELFLENVIEPLILKIISALNFAIFEEEESVKGSRVKVFGLKNYDMFKISGAADKLVASGNATNDEIREELGLPPLPDGMGQVFYMTKNYSEIRKKGGEVKDEDAES